MKTISKIKSLANWLAHKTLHISASLLLAGCLLSGCDRPAASKSSLRPSPATPAATSVAFKPILTAQPNPVPAGSGLGETTITWNTSKGTKGYVSVSVNGGPERLFMKGAQGSEKAAWIGEGATYEFRLYLGTAPTNRLSSITVTRENRLPSRPAQQTEPAAQVHAAR